MILIFTANIFLVCCSDIGRSGEGAAPPTTTATALSVAALVANSSTDDANLAPAVPMDEIRLNPK